MIPAKPRSASKQLLRRKITLARLLEAKGEVVEERERYVIYRFPDGSQLGVPKHQLRLR